jgi:hypothetical protein
VDRRPALVAALVLLGAIAGGTFLLLRLAGPQQSRSAVSPTTEPSVGLDVEPPSAPASSPASALPRTTVTPAGPANEGPPVVLQGDGLGAIAFGAPADEVIAGLTLRWGPPDTDSGWVDAASSPFGACPGNQVRAVGWGGFSVLFSDGPTPHGPAGRRHFFTWEYQVPDTAHPGPDPGGNRPVLRTAKGVSVGATVASLQRAYSDKLELFDEPPGGPRFGVALPDGSIYGSVTTTMPDGLVVTIVSGGGCGE